MRSPDDWAHRLRRRALSIPAVLVGCALATALWPVLLALGLGVDLALRRPRLVTLRLAAWLPGAAWVEALGLLSLGAVWLATARGSPRRGAATFAVQRAYTQAHFAWAAALFALRLQVSGREQAGAGPALVLVNHASLLDVLLPAVVLANPLKLRLRYVLKQELLLEPCLDVAGHFIPNVFVARGGEDTAAALAEVASLGRGLEAGDGVAIYPEGTRLTPARRARALQARRRRPVRAARRHGAQHTEQRVSHHAPF